MRGVPASWLRHLHGNRRIWRDADGLVVVLAGRGGGIRRGRQAVGHRGRRARAAAAT